MPFDAFCQVALISSCALHGRHCWLLPTQRWTSESTYTVHEMATQPNSAPQNSPSSPSYASSPSKSDDTATSLAHHPSPSPPPFSSPQTQHHTSPRPSPHQNYSHYSVPAPPRQYPHLRHGAPPPWPPQVPSAPCQSQPPPLQLKLSALASGWILGRWEQQIWGFERAAGRFLTDYWRTWRLQKTGHWRCTEERCYWGRLSGGTSHEKHHPPQIISLQHPIKWLRLYWLAPLPCAHTT